jgi:amino acid transporter
MTATPPGASGPHDAQGPEGTQDALAAHGLAGAPGLKRSLSIWAAVGLSVALMAPSMAANINPQASATTAGRAVPLTFLIAAIGVLLVAYSFVRLCQYFHHSGSVYAFVGATLGPRAGVFAGWGLLGTYVFYAVVTSTAAGIFGTAFLQAVGIWPSPPTWAPFVLLAVFLALACFLAVIPARRGAGVLLSVEGTTVALIVIVTAVVLVRLLAGNAPGHEHFTWSVFQVTPGTSFSALFLGVVFGFLSFAGFEAAATLGEEANNPTRDIPRAIFGVALFGGVYFVIVTAVEVMGFGASPTGVARFTASPSLLGDLGSSYVGHWVGDVITLGTTFSAFGCCLACIVGAARLMYALSRDTIGPRGVGSGSRWGTPAYATLAVTLMAAVIVIIYTAAAHATAEDSFIWSGTIGTLILLVAYVLATLGATMLVFVRRKLVVPMWQIVIPIAAIIVLGYTLYRNVIPYPTGAAFWFPVVSGAWLFAAIVAVIVAPGTTRRLGAALAAREGIRAPQETAQLSSTPVATAGDETT